MSTPPDDIRRGLQVVTAASVAELQAVAAANATTDPAAARAALFVAAPVVVGYYADAAAALSLDWYDELRDLASLVTPFAPEPVTIVREDYIRKAVAKATEPLWLLDNSDALETLTRQFETGLTTAAADLESLLDAATKESLARLEPIIQKEVAAGFWNTTVENTRRDPEAVGWRRHAREGACRFCRHLASKGAIFKKDTVDFAAHLNCYCTVSPVFNGEDGPEADVMQYVASQRKRTAAEKKRLREYLAKKYPDDAKPVDMDAWVRDNAITAAGRERTN